MEPAEFEKILNDYYRSGTPEKAVAALGHLIATPDFAARPSESLIPAASFFRAVARRNSTAILGYQGLLSGASEAGRRFVQAVLDAALDQKAAPPIEGAADLDWRWGEFLATGEAQPVREIAAVLAWPDRLRERIEGWLAAPRIFGSWRRRRFLKKLAPLGIRSDETGEKLATPVDLDCRSIMQGLAVAADQARTLQQALPKKLTAEALIYMATKATAKWSLATNAQGHPAVLKVCREAVATATGACRLSLLHIAAEASLHGGDLDAAMAAAQEYLAQDAKEPQLVTLLARARQQVNTAQRFAVIEQAAAREPRSIEEGSAALRKCAEATPAQRSYRLKMRVRDHLRSGNPTSDGLASEWELDVVAPDRFAGQRWFWDSESQQALADMWITIGSEHYENPGFWIRWPEPTRSAAHRGLVCGSYLDAVANVTPIAVDEWQHAGSRYLRLEFPEVRLFQNPGELALADIPCAVELWIEKESALLTAVRLRARRQEGEPVDQELRQVFFDYGDKIQIDAPQGIIELPPGTKFQVAGSSR